MKMLFKVVLQTAILAIFMFSTCPAAEGQCGTLEEARAGIIELARMEMHVVEETYGVRFNLAQLRISGLGQWLVVGVPVVGTPGGHYPGEIVGGLVVRGWPGLPDGAVALRQNEGPSLDMIDVRGRVVGTLPICDPNCSPLSDQSSLAVRFETVEFGCVCCYEFCHGDDDDVNNPPMCEIECSPCACQ
jgi:hypothetical protein